MKPSVILHEMPPDDLLQRLEKRFSVTQAESLRSETVSQHAEAPAQVEGLLDSGEKVDATLLEKMPELRATSIVSVGYDNFDVEVLNARRALPIHTPTVLTKTVADMVMALALSTAYRVVEVAECVKVGEWTESIGPDWLGCDVHHKTLGTVGMGHIGMVLAQRVHFGFSMPILYNTRRQHPQAEKRLNARYCDLDTLLQEADFVCLILSPSEKTHHLFGQAQSAKMKPSAIFINAGCGPVADEQALITALQAGEIHAAGFGVSKHEPLVKDPSLLTLPNVAALLYIGFATHETRYNMAARVMDNLIDALNGNVEKNRVNPQVK